MDEELEKNTEQKASNNNEELIICTQLDTNVCGELISLSKNKAEVFFIPKESMVCDESMIYTGFIFNAASYAALCAINKKNSLIISSQTKFLAPIELGQQMIFKANALQSETKKCEVKVEGFLLDIKIFDGVFQIAIFDKKFFKFKLKDNKDNKEI
ncbi:thioesterase [Helicobacter sp. 11S03491-1]|uniref:thioesterase n=1 Tax=Helicobacter sp. 11S03491-1 TaxID=1476196 RepID=UPI000BA4F300|nr:thioesterase [Helicobacter sp. 11S03491-1]PAF42952.1 thioesterase [Helicobacter sp. 11S03491-1]